MTNYTIPLIKPMGEDTILVEFEQEVSWEINGRVRRLLHALDKKKPCGYRMALPSYRSLMVYFDPFAVTAEDCLTMVESTLLELEDMEEPESRLFKFPTVYGGEHGPDVDRLADLAGISSQQVIDLSSNLKLPVFFLGYICSQAYMGGIPEQLQAPRHESPRPLMPGGSFGFGGPQANILAVDSPSGLNYVGRTFVKVFDPTRFPPTAIQPGDYVQCYAVDEETARDAGKKNMEDFIEPIRSSAPRSSDHVSGSR